MATVDRFLEPCSPEQPCGEDLTADPLLHKLRTLIQGKVEEKVVTDESGARRVEAVREDADWREVRKLCEEMLARTRHLEICVIYATALLQGEGLRGAADGLELLAEIVCSFWPHLYPQLDPADEDPAERFGLVENLSVLPAAGYYDPIRFLVRLRATPLVEARGLGALSLANFKDGRIPERGTPDAKPIEAAFSLMRETGEIALVEENVAALVRMRAALEKLRDFLAETPLGRTPDFEGLDKVLAGQERFYQRYSFAANGAQAANAAPTAGHGHSSAGASAGPSQARSSAGAGLAVTGQLESTAQVVELLDRMCAYYEQAEPSSPVPLLLRRARRLVGKTFLEAVTDLAGGPIEQIRVVAGEPAPEPNSET
jgi:type VI secretion system protein ImpA